MCRGSSLPLLLIVYLFNSLFDITYKTHHAYAYAYCSQHHRRVVPDVAIHMRCGDLLGFDPTMYRNNVRIGHHMGFFNFHHYLPLIPESARFIYVISDNVNSATEHFFGPLLQGFVTFLRQRLSPDVDIRVLRGGKVFDAMAILYNAPTSICAASTFCYFATVAKPPSSTVHFPITDLIGASSTPSLGANFRWITDVVLLLPSAKDEVTHFLQQLTAPL